MSAFNVEEINKVRLDCLNIPYNTDLHSDEGFEYFASSIKVNPKLKHLKPYVVKHLRPAA